MPVGWVRWFKVFAMALFPTLASFPAESVIGSDFPVDLTPVIQKCISRNITPIGKSRQLVLATNRDRLSVLVTIQALEKTRGFWQPVFPPFVGSIGEKGFAAIDEKREGDGKSPSGIFRLGAAFGYLPSVVTKMPYRQATNDDYWVDDVNSADYNKWVKGKPSAASWERMKREDDQYKYGIVIEYNTNPVIKGKGSAIFLHVWKDGKPTAGCVAMSEEIVLKILAWLDPAKEPLIIMGTEGELCATSSP